MRSASFSVPEEFTDWCEFRGFQWMTMPAKQLKSLLRAFNRVDATEQRDFNLYVRIRRFRRMAH